MTREEYEERMSALEAETARAREVHIAAKSRFDALCDKQRVLRTAWQDQQKAAAASEKAAQATVAPAGFVIKNSAYPCRTKPHRGRHVHAAAYRTGTVSLTTACNKQQDEETVDHLDEDTPVTCPPCQRNTQG
ncbi:hypothetical protein [Streptomyces sp. NPDC015125]|uniref:hypothetical protein n=1 Tax=Streptomyces sp. NPDC015125 TaxID=3364938 RepID=UPI00370066E1